MDLVDYAHINVVTLGYSCLLLVILIYGLSRGVVSPTRRILMDATILHLVAALGALSVWWFYGRPGALTHTFLMAGAHFSYLFGTLARLALLIYVYANVSANPIQELSSDWLVRLMCAISLFKLVVTLSNPVTEAYFSISERNTFEYGPLTGLHDASLFIQSVLMIPVVLRLRKQNGRAITMRFVACTLLALLAVLMHIRNPRMSVLYPTITLVLVLLCVGVQLTLEEELTRARAETAESRVRLLSGQIRPHFVFNSLAAIKELVSEDADMAEVAIQDFSDYLRSHLDVMSTSRLVPFEQEMDHVRHYVSLERADAGKPIDVRYDFALTDFYVPPLTVQPLVENAIRHGLRTREEGGTVVVATREQEGAVVVSVSDDGHGFSSATVRQDEHQQVGIENVRERLERQCAGTLEVTTGPTGTVAVMTIPQKEEL